MGVSIYPISNGMYFAENKNLSGLAQFFIGEKQMLEIRKYNKIAYAEFFVKHTEEVLKSIAQIAIKCLEDLTGKTFKTDIVLSENLYNDMSRVFSRQYKPFSGQKQYPIKLN